VSETDFAHMPWILAAIYVLPLLSSGYDFSLIWKVGLDVDLVLRIVPLVALVTPGSGLNSYSCDVDP